MFESYEHYFEMPTLPFTLLVCLVAIYWLMMILGAIDLDFFDFDLDLDVDFNAHSSFLDWGMVGLKWFNIGEVPLMVWVSVFAASAWGTSLFFDANLTGGSTQQLATACLRSVGIGLLATKAVTQPLRGRLKVEEPNKIETLLGRRCVVTTVEATGEFGQAECQADGAPLLLNVKTVDGPHNQGTEVEIVDYQPDGRVFLVRAVGPSKAPAS